ncbi:MAG: tetratricopeptide repeat protein [Boseongicola sp. SB0675_bin_26]|nr:tetratricopeptide repeat protein [Boseongicola sp. SB0675_bin_26]
MRALLAAVLLLAAPAFAQDRERTLADIRQELTVLFVEMQRLKRELSTTGAPEGRLQSTNVLERLDDLETEVRRLTATTEQLTNRVQSIVADGTNRIGDLEFRLCELEADCDIASLGETTTLGGSLSEEAELAEVAPVTQADSGFSIDLIDTGGVELALAERADFDRAMASFDQGEFETAVERFRIFTETYQGGPLTGVAHLLRGEALSELGMTSGAARAYLESYSGTPDGPTAPVALLKLGLSLDGLGQVQEACITLSEVTLRFPESDASVEAKEARTGMTCP